MLKHEQLKEIIQNAYDTILLLPALQRRDIDSLEAFEHFNTFTTIIAKLRVQCNNPKTAIGSIEQTIENFFQCKTNARTQLEELIAKESLDRAYELFDALATNIQQAKAILLPGKEPTFTNNVSL